MLERKISRKVLIALLGRKI